MRVGTVTRSKRQQALRYPVCKDAWKKPLSCDRKKIEFHCQFRGRDCVYWVQCDDEIIKRQSPYKPNECKFVHKYNSLVCCEFKCPTK